MSRLSVRKQFAPYHIYFALVVVILFVYAQALLPTKTLIADVLFRCFLGQYSLLQESLAKGVFPFWNPYVMNGVPFLGNSQSSVFYPLTYLFVLFEFATAIKWHVVLHAFI